MSEIKAMARPSPIGLIGIVARKKCYRPPLPSESTPPATSFDALIDSKKPVAIASVRERMHADSFSSRIKGAAASGPWCPGPNERRTACLPTSSFIVQHVISSASAGLDTARTLGYGRLVKTSPRPHHASSGSIQQHRARGSASSELERFVLADWAQGYGDAGH